MYWYYRNLHALQHDLSFNVFSLTKLNAFNASSIPCVGEPFNQHVFEFTTWYIRIVYLRGFSYCVNVLYNKRF